MSKYYCLIGTITVSHSFLAHQLCIAAHINLFSNILFDGCVCMCFCFSLLKIYLQLLYLPYFCFVFVLESKQFAIRFLL